MSKFKLINLFSKLPVLFAIGIIVSGFVGLLPWIEILEKNPEVATDEYLAMQRIPENYAIYVYHLNQHEFTFEYENKPVEDSPIQSLVLSAFPHYAFNKLFGLNGIILFHGIVNILIFIIIYTIWRQLDVGQSLSVLFALAFTSQFTFYALSSLRQLAVNFIEVYPFQFKLTVAFVFIVSIYLSIQSLFKQKQSHLVHSIFALLCCIIAVYFQHYWNYFRDARPYSTQIFNYLWILGLILLFKKKTIGLWMCSISAALLAQTDPFTFVPLCLTSIIVVAITRFWSFCSLKQSIGSIVLFFVLSTPLLINQILIAQSNFNGTHLLMDIPADTAFKYIADKHIYAFILTTVSFVLLTQAYKSFACIFPLLINILATLATLPTLYFTFGKFIQTWHYWTINPASVTLYTSFSIPAAVLIFYKSFHDLIHDKRDLSINNVYQIQSNKFHTPSSSCPIPIAIYLLGIFTVISSINSIPEEDSLDKKTTAQIELTAELKKPKYSGKVLGTSDLEIMWYWSVLGNPSLNPSPISGIPISELKDRFAYYSSLFTQDREGLKQWLLNHAGRESWLLSLYSKGQNKSLLSETERRKLMILIKEKNYSTYRCDYILIDDTMDEIVSDELLKNYKESFKNDAYTLYRVH